MSKLTESRGRCPRVTVAGGVSATLVLAAGAAAAWTPMPVDEDPLVRMPGSQPADGLVLESQATCLGCHRHYDEPVEPGHNYLGSMMSQAARDPLFWASVTVALQDSIWATGRPNAGDLCLRCHTPPGWLAGHSDPVNGANLMGTDHDGITCDTCHRMVDPFFTDTAAGTREGDDWSGYWDETGASTTPSAAAAQTTVGLDQGDAASLTYFNANPFYDDSTWQPASPGWTENGGGQYLISASSAKRGPFADATRPPLHDVRYSRYHKSRYFCGTCHDVSNAVLANLGQNDTSPGDGSTVLTSESAAAHSYGHIERTFSEFMLSDYGRGPGRAGRGAYAPDRFATSRPGNRIATCQDCHMGDASGAGAAGTTAIVRPDESVEHPNSGQPVHDLTGGNLLIPYILASTDPTSPNYDSVNESLLVGRAVELTMDLEAGTGIHWDSLLDGVDRAQRTLTRAARLTNVSYDVDSGALSFRVVNDTGHKLISGFPEGRRMWVNIRLFDAQGALLHEVNPYDNVEDTLRGLAGGISLTANETHEDQLVYEVLNASSLTGESHTFHIALGTERHKDNRIPPQGFRIAEAATRLCDPVINGTPAPDHFTAEEYAGGYDAIALNVPAGAERVVLALYYQTTSREYAEFLRDEINGTATTLTAPTPSGESSAYIAQVDDFFAGLRDWGNTIWQLWDNNRDVPGAAPVLMTSTVIDLGEAGGAGGAGGEGGTARGGDASSAAGTSGTGTSGTGTSGAGQVGGAAGTGTGVAGTAGGGAEPIGAGAAQPHPNGGAQSRGGAPSTGGVRFTGGSPAATSGGRDNAGGEGGGAAPSRKSSDDSGCGCRSANTRPSQSGWLWLAAAGVWFTRRRRRAPRPRLRCEPPPA